MTDGSICYSKVIYTTSIILVHGRLQKVKAISKTKSYSWYTNPRDKTEP